jgi:hypothetical protein
VGSCEEIAAAVCDRRGPSFARWKAALTEHRDNFSKLLGRRQRAAREDIDSKQVKEVPIIRGIWERNLNGT